VLAELAHLIREQMATILLLAHQCLLAVAVVVSL
jgi:hypothetical protein